MTSRLPLSPGMPRLALASDTSTGITLQVTTGPRGPKGDKGDIGPAGGPMGPPGPAGPQGLASGDNLLINGGMELDQEHLGSATTLTATSYAVDGWIAAKSGSMVCTAQQVADAPAGFTSSLKVTVGTASAVLGTNDYTIIKQPIEGYRSSMLAFGTASAQSVTLSFWSKIHRTGNYSGALLNFASNRSYPFSFTHNAADAWQFNTVSIPGDTIGAWVGNTNAGALVVVLCMAGGTTVVATAGTWASASAVGVTGTVNGVAATTDVFQITGVSLFAGSSTVTASASINLKRTYEKELLLCQRYYYADYGPLYLAIEGTSTGSNQIILTGQFPQQMRVTPTVTYPNWSTSGVSGPVGGFLSASGFGLSALSNSVAGTRMWITASTGSVKADARM